MHPTHQDRRACDKPDWDGHDSPCTHLRNIEAAIFEKLEKLDSIEANQTAMKEMLEAWNNTKGFMVTLRSVGKVLLWVVSIVGAVAIISEAIKRWLLS